MNYGPDLLLVAVVATVGVLHTIVPDHWVPITLIARQRGWSKSETALAVREIASVFNVHPATIYRLAAMGD